MHCWAHAEVVWHMYVLGTLAESVVPIWFIVIRPDYADCVKGQVWPFIQL
jgi:hypothetical protein